MIDFFFDDAALVEFPDSQQSVAAQILIETKQSATGYRSLIQVEDRNTSNLFWFGRTDATGNLRVILPAIYAASAELLITALDDTGGFDTDHVIDPFGGRADLQAHVLRHVTAAFAEDPVRILRLARFAARFADFSVASDTMALMRQMVEDGEAPDAALARLRAARPCAVETKAQMRWAIGP